MVKQIKSIISKYKTSSQVEIQQRAVELHVLDDTRIALLERVPVLESAIKEFTIKSIKDHVMQIIRKVDVLELTENQVPTGNVIDTIKHPYFDFLSPKTLEKGLNAMKMMSRRVTIISL